MAEKLQGNSEPIESVQGEESAPEFMTAKQANAMMTGYMKKIEKMISSSRPATAEPDGSNDANDKAPKAEDVIARKLAALEKRDSEREAVFKQRETAIKDKEMRALLTEKLLDAGASKRHVAKAVGFLLDTEKAVGRDEDDSIVWRIGADALTDLDTAAKLFMKSPDAALYTEPRGTTGTGQQSIRKPAERVQKSISSDDLADAILGAWRS